MTASKSIVMALVVFTPNIKNSLKVKPKIFKGEHQSKSSARLYLAKLDCTQLDPVKLDPVPRVASEKTLIVINLD